MKDCVEDAGHRPAQQLSWILSTGNSSQWLLPARNGHSKLSMTSVKRITHLMTELQATREDERRVPLLAELLLEEGHDRHEDLVFELGLIGDPSAVPAISKAIKIHFAELVRWDNLHEFQRKCAYALARIGTDTSRDALEEIAKSDDPFLREYGLEGLEHWPMPYQRR